jgi:hypothetical protein
MHRILLALALALAISIDGFFALVNFYPVAPSHSRGPRRELLAELDPAQARWFQQNMLDAYNAEYDANVHLRVVESERLPGVLAGASGHGAEALLAVLPTELAAQAARSGAVRPFDGAVAASEVRAELAALQPAVVTDARLDGRQWFVPRHTVLDVGVYRVSRVRDAELHWAMVRPQVEAALRAVNGRGLPVGYQLEHDPATWDSYDLFVLAWYWAHRSYHGEAARARVAHRAGYSTDAAIDLASAVHRLGGTSAELPRFDANPVRDHFAWEALYRRAGLYPEAMFGDEPFDDEALLGALQAGEVFFAHVDQMEAFTLHGGGHRGTPAHVADPEDLGFVAVPRGASLALDERGKPARHGEGFSFRETAVWALPARSPDPAMAWHLVRFLLARENHYRECEALGMMPLRRDVVRERASIFRLPWMAAVFEAGFAQWPSSEMVPAALLTTSVGDRYAGLWEQIVARRTVAPEQGEALAAALRAEPPPHAAAPAEEPAAPEAAPAPPDDDDDDPPIRVSVEAWRETVVLVADDAATGDAAADGAEAGR